MRYKVLFLKAFNSATLMTWLNFSTKILSTVLVLPLILKNFIASEISLWYLFSSIIVIQLLCDFGFNSSFVRVFSYGLGGVKKDELRIINKKNAISFTPDYHTIELAWYAMKYVYSRLSIAVFILYVLFGTYMLYKPINNLPNPIIGYYCWSIIVFSSIFQFYGNIYYNYLEGMNKIALVNRWGSIFSLLTILSSFLVLIFHGSLLSLVIVIQSWSFVNIIRNRYLSRKIEKGLLKKFINPVIDKDVLSSIWNSAWRSAIGVIMSNVVIQASGLIFAQIGNVSDVASYLFSFRLISTVSSFSLAPFYSKIPNLSRLRAEGKIDEMIIYAQKGMRLTYFSFLLGFISIGFSADFLLKLIGSHAHFASPLLWILMGLGFFIERYGAMHIQVYSTTNHIIWHIANGVTGTLYLILSFGLIKYIGVYAFPLAMIVSYLSFYSWYSASNSYKSIGVSFFAFESKAVLVPALILLAYIILKLIIL